MLHCLHLFWSESVLNVKFHSKRLTVKFRRKFWKFYRIHSGCIQCHFNRLHAEAYAYIITCLIVLFCKRQQAIAGYIWFIAFLAYLLNSLQVVKNSVMFHEWFMQCDWIDPRNIFHIFIFEDLHTSFGAVSSSRFVWNNIEVKAVWNYIN